MKVGFAIGPFHFMKMVIIGNLRFDYFIEIKIAMSKYAFIILF